MKKIILALGIILITTSAKAQWADSRSNLTTSDNVGLRTPMIVTDQQETEPSSNEDVLVQTSKLSNTPDFVDSNYETKTLASITNTENELPCVSS